MIDCEKNPDVSKTGMYCKCEENSETDVRDYREVHGNE
jgi:hypothetical protein